jgi:hypothetical protein
MGAHAFRVAARPSLDLSLPHAANTRMPFYTWVAELQFNSSATVTNWPSQPVGISSLNVHVLPGSPARQ